MRQKKVSARNYLKNADELLISTISRIQSAFGIHRNVWQILHSVHERGWIHIHELKKIMLPFAEPDTVQNLLTKLRITCVIFNTEDKITLTSNGLAFYKSYF